MNFVTKTVVKMTTNLEINTVNGNFLIMDFPPQLNELSYTEETNFNHEGKSISPIEFVKRITEEQCKGIVETYGLFGEYKGSRHPNGGTMIFRAYGTAKQALKCIIDESGLNFKNGYLFKIKDN